MSQQTFVYDPSTAEFQRDMHDVYRTMRDRYPVYATSRFADLWNAIHDPETFSSDGVAEAAELMPQMIYMDPPRHTELRALVSRAFTPRRVAKLGDRVREVARELIGGFAAAGRCDLVHDLAAPVPSTIMGELIGVPPEHSEQFRSWTEAFLEVTSPADIAERATGIYGLFGELLAQRRRSPSDDLMSGLIAAEMDGQRLTESDLLGFCILLLVAGNDTTTTLIGNGAELLARHPEQRAELVNDPSLIPDAVEEMLRIESPTQALPRTATRDSELHGTPIPAGARVMLLFGAANLDEREFTDPETFDIHRQPTRHLAFGHGIHYCLGAMLARLESRVVFEELLPRVGSYELAAEPERYTSNWARAWRTLPVQFPAP
ncbi:MAG TPA: cytochrome P450 [Mycobacteriales bacterium]|nr:cytochrome P450 [Mycobacteriales bacterium]